MRLLFDLRSCLSLLGAYRDQQRPRLDDDIYLDGGSVNLAGYPCRNRVYLKREPIKSLRANLISRFGSGRLSY